MKAQKHARCHVNFPFSAYFYLPTKYIIMVKGLLAFGLVHRSSTKASVVPRPGSIHLHKIKRGLETKGKFSEYQLTRKETLPTFRLDALVFFRAKVKLDANTCYLLAAHIKSVAQQLLADQEGRLPWSSSMPLLNTVETSLKGSTPLRQGHFAVSQICLLNINLPLKCKMRAPLYT